MNLALKYRPRVFADVTGQKKAVVPLYRMAKLGTLDEKPLLLCGSRGCGKTSTARILGAAMNCESADQQADRWPCGACPSCQAVAAGNSLDVIEVDAASNGGVDAVRKLREIMAYGSPGAWKFLLLDEAHAMSRDAFNALLKMMEEPADRTVFVLLTTEPAKILPTVTDRCMTFTFRPIQPALIAERLAYICQAEGIGAGPDLLAAIADRAGGGMRNGVMLLDQVTSVLRPEELTLAHFEDVFGAGDYALPLVSAMTAGDYPAVYAALEEALAQAVEPSDVIGTVTDFLCDLLRLICGDAITAQGAALAARQQLAAGLDADRVSKAMRVLWDFMTKVRVPDRQAGIKLAARMLTEQLCPRMKTKLPGPPAAAVNGSNGHAASLDDLKQAFGAM